MSVLSRSLGLPSPQVQRLLRAATVAVYPRSQPAAPTSRGDVAAVPGATTDATADTRDAETVARLLRHPLLAPYAARVVWMAAAPPLDGSSSAVRYVSWRGSTRREVGWHRGGGEGGTEMRVARGMGPPLAGLSVERLGISTAADGVCGERLPPLSPCLCLLRSRRLRVDQCSTVYRWSRLWLGGAGTATREGPAV